MPSRCSSGQIAKLAARPERRWSTQPTAESTGVPRRDDRRGTATTATEAMVASNVTTVVTVDDRGRLPLAQSGTRWGPGTPVALAARQGGLAITRVARRGGRQACVTHLDRRGRVLVPPGIRHLAHVGPGERVVILTQDDGDGVYVVATSRAAGAILDSARLAASGDGSARPVSAGDDRDLEQLVDCLLQKMAERQQGSPR
jgi:bifunctional DNA-binding transcriptional regulator/antitoxin component of YhaV-PrlF toxin-antitoxin module